MTPATWMRRFVQSHPAYKNDSVVSQEIAHDLMIACHRIGTGEQPCPDILGSMKLERCAICLCHHTGTHTILLINSNLISFSIHPVKKKHIFQSEKGRRIWAHFDGEADAQGEVIAAAVSRDAGTPVAAGDSSTR